MPKPSSSKLANALVDENKAPEQSDGAAFAAAVARGRAQIEAGQVVDGQRVAEWVASWGAGTELPRPKPVPPSE